MTEHKVEVKISDLFQKRGYNFDWDQRIQDQNIVIERIHEANKDILNPYAIEITHIAEEIKEFCNDHIASMVFLEYAMDRLTQVGVTLT
jgi:hypothetical protein